MFHVVLVEPQIPPNTGNVIRLCANVGATLHLVRPLGFDVDDASLRRAGLDYHEFVTMSVHDDLAACRAAIAEATTAAGADEPTWYAYSRHGALRYTDVAYRPGDVLVFGSEPTGLSPEHRAGFGDNLATLPMRPDNRSLNLSNSVAIVCFEAWRQNGFAGSA